MGRLSTKNNFQLIAIITIALFAMVPLFFNFPYRVNIFLSWEGAYRMYQGQMPFKDFGLPMGYGYWIIPSIFFRIFGPSLLSLIKAQTFINIISGLSFLSILNSLKIKDGVKPLAVLVFCISYSFFNFWPWYNHSVIVYELIAIALALKGISSQNKYKFVFTILAALFTFLSLFTKQDGGGMALLIVSSLVIVNFIYDRKVNSLVYYFGGYLLFACIFILPLTDHGFSYWFNYGQEPHNSRLSLKDFADAIFGASNWIKFYLLVIIILLTKQLKEYKTFFENKNQVLFSLLTIAILVEALLFQVTSYTPPDNNIFFHSFAFAFLLVNLNFGLDFSRPRVFFLCAVLVMLWWSGSYWKYIDRVLKRAIPSYAETDSNKISVKTFMISKDSSNVQMDKWGFSTLNAFKGVYMPESTVDGMDRLLELTDLKVNNPKVLNMTELTPLAVEVPFELEKGLPLWYHVGVGMFEKEEAMFCERIENQYYDVILFETIPYLNNFFPEKVRESAIKNYEKIDRFLAPRRPTDSHIEVYVRKK